MPDVAEDVDERPIIFNEWSITRILAGAKTQTRRLTGLDEINEAPDEWEPVNQYRSGTVDFQRVSTHRLVGSPYGQPGDVLWVREAFRLIESCDRIPPSEALGPVKYCADGHVNTGKGQSWGKKRPSIFMPYELCRLRLRVEDVSVERVQEITPQDAQAEGVGLRYEPTMPNGEPEPLNPVGGFKKLWNDIHGDGAWQENPWVWVVSFSRTDT